MSRKAFIIWGLALIHAYLLAWAIGMYLVLSKTIHKDLFFSQLSIFFALTLFLGFGVLLWKRFKTIGRRKRTLAWCALFYVASWLFMVSCVAVFATYIADFATSSAAYRRFFDAIHAWSENGGVGPILTPLQKIDYIFLALIPFKYLNIWGLFALLWFGSRDPKTPLPLLAKFKSKRAANREIKHAAQRIGGVAHV